MNVASRLANRASSFAPSVVSIWRSFGDDIWVSVAAGPAWQFATQGRNEHLGDVGFIALKMKGTRSKRVTPEERARSAQKPAFRLKLLQWSIFVTQSIIVQTRHCDASGIDADVSCLICDMPSGGCSA